MKKRQVYPSNTLAGDPAWVRSQRKAKAVKRSRTNSPAPTPPRSRPPAEAQIAKAGVGETLLREMVDQASKRILEPKAAAKRARKAAR